MIDNEPFKMCKEQKQLAAFIRKVLKDESDNLYIDEERANK